MTKKTRKTIIQLLKINALVTFGWSVFAPFAILIAQESGLSVQQAGFAWGMYSFLAGILMIIFAKFEDELHLHSALYTLGIILLILGSVAGLTIQGNIGFYVALIFYSAGFGFSTPAFQTIYAKSQIKGEEASEWSWMDGSNMLIMGVAAVIAGYIANNYGVTYIYLASLPLYIIGLGLSIKLFKLVRLS